MSFWEPSNIRHVVGAINVQFNLSKNGLKSKLFKRTWNLKPMTWPIFLREDIYRIHI